MKKRLLAGFLAAAMLVMLCPMTALAGGGGVSYLDEKGDVQNYEGGCTAINNTNAPTDWNNGWYIVNSNVALSSRITVSGNVHLILADGCKLTAENGGINVAEGNSLTIYAQSTGSSMGQLTAAGGQNQAGIGGGHEAPGGSITINGGNVTATGGGSGAGIGTGNGGSGSTTIINGGTVTANGGSNGAGIGGGWSGGSNSTTTINGGSVMANGGTGGAGIGGGFGSSGGTTTINGGSVTATGSGGGAGIGGSGYNGAGGSITINGGIVTATGDIHGAGIGGGQSGAGGTITITGGAVTAKGGGNGGIGIGGGRSDAGDTITISGGTVTATGAGVGEGIGGESDTFSTGTDGSAFIIASSIQDQSKKEEWSGVIFEGNAGQVYGSPALATDAEVPSGKTLTIPEGKTLTIDTDVILTNNGTIINNSIIIVKGTLINNGTITNNGVIITLPSGGGTVKPTEGGGVTVPGGSTVQTGDTTITIPEGGGEVKPTEGGGVTVSGGSTVKTGDDGPEVKLPQGGTIGGDGGITIPGGGTAQVGTSPSTTITVPEGGGTIQPKPGGAVDVPGGSTIKTGDDGPEITVGPGNGGTVGGDGGITVPEGGTVQVGKDPATTITPPAGGEVKPKEDGTVEVPEGTTVKPGGGGPEVTVGPENGGTVGDDGGVTVEGGGKVTVKGDPDDTTITLPSGGGTVKPNPDGTIPLPGGSTVEKGGTTTDIPDTGGTYDPSTGAVTENVHTVTFDSQGGSAVNSATATHGGKVVKPGNPTRSGYTFGGWYKESGCTTAWNFDTDTVTGDITLYAKWTQNSGGGGGWYNPPSVTTYPVTTPATSSHGKQTVSPVRASRNTTVTITVIPEDGYRLGVLNVTSGGKSVPLTEKGGGKYTFTMPAGTVKVEATFVPAEAPGTPWSNPFADVLEGAWYYDAVRFVSENGLMGGYGTGRFGPNDNLSRAQLAQILFNKEGRPVVNYLMDFSDVAGEAWYAEAIRWAASEGIVGGYGDGTFGPDDPITREQLAVMLWRYSGSPAATDKERHFNDADEISPFAEEAMGWAVENGIVGGYGDGRLDPQGQATRAQAAQMLKNFIENQEENT